MLDYDNMVKALRLSWVKRIVDPDYVGFWKSYFDRLLVNEVGRSPCFILTGGESL